MKWAAWALSACATNAVAIDWVIAVPEGRAETGARFELIVVAPANQTPPDSLTLSLRVDVAEIPLTVLATEPGAGTRRGYAGTMPPSVSGTLTLRLADRASNLLVVVVTRRDAVQTLTGRPPDEREPPLSEEEPMYFIAGIRGGITARFQLSFKYRLFDTVAGYGHNQPWLSGFYFGYTQNSLWDLSEDSAPFHDTSYRPSFFWKWQRAEGATLGRSGIDALRLGYEHESNGRGGLDSRSVHTLFMRPEWRWSAGRGGMIEFTPKFYAYLAKDDNPDMQEYRGYVDWRLRHDVGGQWITTLVARTGTAGKASVLVDLSRRTRDIKVGPLSGYLHVQFFNGFGESILDYNVRRKAQLRVGLAIVP